MDDQTSKAEKLAAARKKLKEFQNQQRNKQNVVPASNWNTNVTIESSQPAQPPHSTAGHFAADGINQQNTNIDPLVQVFPPSIFPSSEDIRETQSNNAPFNTGSQQSETNLSIESILRRASNAGKQEQQPQLANYFTVASAPVHSETPIVFFENTPQNSFVTGTSSTFETSPAGVTTYTGASSFTATDASPLLFSNQPAFGSLSSPKVDNDLSTKQTGHSDIIPPTKMSANINEFSNGVAIPDEKDEDDKNTIFNVQMIEQLQRDLQSALSKIELQSQALNIITNEREDLQIRLSKALREVDVHQDSIRSLKDELQSNAQIRQQMLSQINEFTETLENSRASETTLRQDIKDYQAENETLKRRLDEMNVESDKLRTELNKTQYSRDMLALKFTQLGIEVNDTADTTDKNYGAIDHELECSKRKCAELEIQLKSLTFERESANNEYKQYVQSVQQELAQTQSEMEKLEVENQQLLEKITSQTEHIYALEKQLQQQRSNARDEVVDAGQVAVVEDLRNEILSLKQDMDEMKNQYEEQLYSHAMDENRWKESVCELESQLEILKSESANSEELQAAIESNKVAASQAISQNNKLKDELEKLNRLIETLKNENETLKSQLSARESSNANDRAIDQSDNITTSKNDVAINTENVETNNDSNGHVNMVAMTQLQEKFKSVLDKMADLTDEKQQLEHLVLQLQSETETIEEYVALYQKQRMVLRQRARENDHKLERISQEKQRLLNIIRTILTTNHSDRSVIKQLIERNLSAEMKDELSQFGNFANTAATTAVDGHSTAGYTKMNSFYATSESLEHHPTCHCCSGKLITV